MQTQILIAGGGIGGLAAALGATRAGAQVRLFERAPAFTEVGAGVQLGPNVVRQLQAWGLQQDLRQVAAFPQCLQVRCALGGQILANMSLGTDFIQRYGAAYITIHRADLQGLLLGAVRQQAADVMQWTHGQSALAFAQDAQGVTLELAAAARGVVQVRGDALIGADGLRSTVRAQLLGAEAVRASGHLAYRAVLRQADLPASLRSQLVTVWLGPQLHVVHYPLRGGELLNMVAIRHGQAPVDLDTWDHRANAQVLESVLGHCCAALQDLARAPGHCANGWRLWPLLDRPSVASAHEMAQGRVALLGDAAHPMRPYLAQGAGMAIEDAGALQRALQLSDKNVSQQLHHYAQQRWQRNAWVQQRAERNGRVFHASGPVRWGRNLALRLLGQRLLDQPWLYRGVDIST